MQEFSLDSNLLDTCDPPENTLMECVKTFAPLARTSAQTFRLFPENRFPGAGEGI